MVAIQSGALRFGAWKLVWSLGFEASQLDRKRPRTRAIDRIGLLDAEGNLKLVRSPSSFGCAPNTGRPLTRLIKRCVTGDNTLLANEGEASGIIAERQGKT